MKKPTLKQFKALLIAASYCTDQQTLDDGCHFRRGAFHLWSVVDTLRKQFPELNDVTI